MTQQSDSVLSDPVIPVDLPLSERPLVVSDDVNTVISVPEGTREEERPITTVLPEALRQRLFPAGGGSNGEELGVSLAQFEIQARIGSGGMGAVFRATDTELSRDVALKVLHPSFSGDTSMVSRFRNEARACARLNHDNIARVFFSGQQDGLLFIAYELADGRTIRDLIQEKGQLSVGETVNYAIQATLALNHIAAAGIVHRDIKPSNIMLTEAGRVKVVDLGLARRDVADSIGDITVAGTTLGTFDYLAPEQARDPRSADIRSDIYSLGCTMYHMVTGHPPYPEGTALQKLLDHQAKSPPDPGSINLAVPPELSAVIRRMMANSPDQRYQAPAFLMADLLRIAQLLGLRSIPAEGIVWRRVDNLSPRTPLGAIWIFMSVVAICLTAVFLQLDRIRDVAPSDLVVFPEGSVGQPIAAGEFNDGAAAESRTGFSSAGPSAAATGTTASAGSGGGGGGGAGGNSVAAAGSNGATLLPDPQQPGQTSIPFPFPAVTFSVLSPAILQVPLTFSDGWEALAVGPDSVTQPIGPFLLQTEDGLRHSKKTLQAAIADAKSGDVILLRYNGDFGEIPRQPPVRIVGMNLIIRADEGFRPTLELSGGNSHGLAEAAMFTLRRGTLTIRDVDLRMKASDASGADHWTIFRLDGPSRVQLENVTLDCDNRIGQPMSVFDLADGTAASDDVPGSETLITLNRVVCRGEVDGFRISGQPLGRIRVQNSAFALEGAFVRALGSAGYPQVRGKLELSLEHASFLLAGPLLFMNDTDGVPAQGIQRVLPHLTVRSEACVYASSALSGRLVESKGNSFVEDIDTSLSWNGFTNLYYRFGVYWQIETAALDYSSRRLDFFQWRQFWQNRADSEESNAIELNDLAWVDTSWVSDTSFQPRSCSVTSFQLSPRPFQASEGWLPVARDGLIPGVSVDELPPFPSVPVEELSKPVAEFRQSAEPSDISSGVRTQLPASAGVSASGSALSAPPVP